ncbi:MAG TPA: hypothetical protein VLD57_00520 [Blastocatellia bacterium]|nr:hypothetical protein [Blastocatellia bacterium]
MRAISLFLTPAFWLLAPGFWLLTQGATASQSPAAIDTALAHQYFQEARAACLKDNGALWGISLDGPMMFADPRTRSIVANQKDTEGKLTAAGNVFIGTLPATEIIANNAIKWAGVEWTMVMWPLPEDKHARLQLMMHESFHRIQDEIGLPAANPANEHLGTMEGRMLMRLEWRALRQALGSSDDERRRAIEDALVFRSYRRELFKAADTERGLEMNEGLSEYTGVKLNGRTPPEIIAQLRARLESAEKRATFVRSFAYISGPAYGILLDETAKQWRKNLTPRDDFGALLQMTFSITLPANLKDEAEKRSLKYSGDTVRAEETEREEARKKRMADHRRRFVDGPLLILPLTDNVQYGFDPGNIEALEGHGTVYPNMRVVDAWGILEVSGGALMIREGQRVARVHVTAPQDVSARPLAGEGWKLTLNSGWSLVPSERKGDYTLKKQE